jgi:2-keto-3-deoxy-L-fuconate dehydrogenase
MARTLITGAASGIGLALATRLAEQGHDLVLVDLHAGDPALGQWLMGDVCDEGFWSDSAAALAELDHAAVNAGISGAGAIADLDFTDWRRVMAVNLDGAFLTLRAALRAMRDGGSIVVTASAAALKAEPGIAAYAASKAAVIQLAKVAAKEGAPRGIRVNAIAPGGVDTPLWDTMPFFQQLAEDRGGHAAAIEAMAKAGTPLGFYAEPNEIAAQIAFLLSDDARSITGSVLTVDGGYTL